MALVKIKGVIVPNDSKWIYEWFEIDATSPNDVTKSLEAANGENVDVEINSPGGSVYDGSEIYTALKSYPGRVNVKIVGVAASAASVIAMAGDHVQISPTAQIMIHNVSTNAGGDYRDLEHEAAVLKNYNKSIANAYILKTGLSQDELLSLMDQETWLNAQQAKEKGFADEVMFDTGNQLVASLNQSQMLPPAVIEKIRNTIKNPLSSRKNTENKTDIFARQQTRLNLLKLKGDEM
ncbi:head maturation protease, ClpP-related [Paenibacillus puldeungensis]|uniref:ATP-dependent Clp protease proteolytic subunit n=1 Tax=Paenibacillus puldeungensis TaxID=696536 RepID=A0ABW3RWK0_9BACL